MTIEAELADGRILEFPDGTDPSVIQTTVKKMLGQDKQPNQFLRGAGIFARDVAETVAGGADAIANVPAMIGNVGYAPIGAAVRAMGGTPEADIPTSNAFQSGVSDLLDRLGVGIPETPGERVASEATRLGIGAGAFATGAGAAANLAKAGSITQGVAQTLATQPLLQTLGGAAAGAASQGVKETGGGPIAQGVAGLLGGIAPFGLERAAVGLAGGASKIAAPFSAAASREAAERQAGATLARRASDPAAAAEALSADGQIVNGSLPTTFQQSGDMGLGSLEREVAARNSAPFAARRAEQNAARVEALQKLQTGSDPNDVAKAVRAQLDDLDRSTQTLVDDALERARSAGEAIGGNGTPEGIGADLRGVVDEAEAAARAQERGLWQAVDPDGTLTGNTVQTSSAAREISGGVASTAKPIAGEEAAIFEAAQGLPQLAPVSDLIALRSRVSTEMRNELIANGRSPSYARLTALRGAIQDNLANTISHQVVMDDAAVAKGVLDPSNTALNAIKSWQDEFYKNRAEARGVDPSSHGGIRDGGSSAVSGLRGTAGEAGRAPAGASGNTGLPGLAPSFDEAAGQRLTAATEATKARAGTFGSGPVGQTLAKAGSATTFRLPDGQVAGKFFHPGPTGFSDMQALLKAQPQAFPIIEDYAATTLRRAALTPEGVIDPKKFATWRKAFDNALRGLPEETKAKFADAAKAGQAVSDAMASRSAQLKDAQQGSIGKVMGLTSPEDVTRAVGQVLNGSEPAKNMLALAKATAGDPQARAGLRQAVADFIQQSLIGNTEAGTSGVTLIKADQFQTFMKKAKPALRLIFDQDEVSNLEAIAADIQRAKRSENAVRLAGGSNTAQDLIGATKGRSNSLLDRLVTAAGGLVGLEAHGWAGALAGLVGTEVVQALRRAGIDRVDQLITEAMLNPDIGRRLLLKAPKDPAPAARSLAAAITQAQIASFSALSNSEAAKP
jgi:hypothetical protein